MADRRDWDRERSLGRWDSDRGRDWHEHEEWNREDRVPSEWHRGEGRPRGDFPRYGDGWGVWHTPAFTGRYAGRGPKNYVRSDERIWEDVNERLTEHPGIDATDVEVSVKQGEVTLSGMVEDRRSKHLAEELAESVAGVKDVYNQIHVQHAEVGMRGASAFGRRIERG